MHLNLVSLIKTGFTNKIVLFIFNQFSRAIISDSLQSLGLQQGQASL